MRAEAPAERACGGGGGGGLRLRGIHCRRQKERVRARIVMGFVSRCVRVCRSWASDRKVK